MDRDRDRDRRPYDRDRERERDRLGGESYRPRRSPPRDSFRGGPSAADTYVPRGPRGRSRSPEFRRRERSPPRERIRSPVRRPSPGRRSPARRSSPGRRSPPPRRFSPPRRDDDRRPYRDDDRARYRSPVRDQRYNRSPRRDRSRSPYGKRGRDFSPAGRSPPPKRERVASPPRNRYPSRSPPRRGFSPRGRDDRRDRSPRRDDRYEPESRRRSPEPQTYASNSANTSRPASPPVHPSRARLVSETIGKTSPAYGSPGRSPRRRDSPPPREPEREREFKQPNGPAREDSPYRNGDVPSRVPPSGPRSSLSISVISPPSGPAAGSPVSARGRYNSVLSAPSHPRGRGFGGYPARDFSGPPRRGRDFSGPPPRGGGYGPGPSPRGGHFANFRGSGNSTSATYPRTQRFDTPSTHLSDLPSIIPGGQKAPPRDPVAEAKIRKLEEEAERLRSQIADKQKGKRNNVRDWDKLSGETQSAKLRAEFAEENLAKVNGDDTTAPAF